MAVDKRLLEILVCPATKIPVKPLPRDRLAILNREVSSGGVSFNDGTAVEEPLDEGLITTDGKTVYPVMSGIPVMLQDRGIATQQIPGW